jgi:fibronectin-binding autotransporter adhesin
MNTASKTSIHRKVAAKIASVALTAVAVYLVGGSTAQAASQSWTETSTVAGATNLAWTNTANWGGNAAPGATGTTNNTDTATFSADTVAETITVDSNRNLQNFIINTGSTGYTFLSSVSGSNIGALILSNNGSVVLNSTVANTVTSFYSNNSSGGLTSLYLEGNYGFFANTGLLHLVAGGTNGNITNNATGTITLGGTSGIEVANSYGLAQNINYSSAAFFQASGTTSLTKTGTGTWALIASNGAAQNPYGSNYTGTTTIDGGILNVNLLANEGDVSAIGMGSLAASSNGVGSAGDLVINGGELQFSGSQGTTNELENDPNGQSTNRLFTIGNGDLSAGTANTAQIDSSDTFLAAYNSAQGTISFTNTGALAFGTASPGAHTLTLSGINIGNNIFDPQILDQAGGGATSLVKTGPGTWILGGSNSYTGTTTISGGVLDDATGSGVSTASVIAIQGTGGIYQSAGNIIRPLGTTTNVVGGNTIGDVSILGGRAGFGAYGGAVTLTLNTPGTPVQFGSATFNPSEYVLNGNSANNTITATDSYDLNGLTRTIETDANTAIMSGAIVNNAPSNGNLAGLSKAGNGTLQLTAINSYNGLTGVSGGVLYAKGAGTLGTNTGVVNVGGGGELRFDSLGALPGTVLLNHGTLGITTDQTTTALKAVLNSASTGLLALDGSTQTDQLDMSKLGAGGLYLGSASTGTYSASSLGITNGGVQGDYGTPGGIATFGGNYLLGGGGGTIIFTAQNVLTNQTGSVLLDNVTSGAPGQSLSTSNNYNSVVIGDGSTAGQTNGGGTVDLQASQNYNGTTTINAGATLVLDYSKLGAATAGAATTNIIDGNAPVILDGGTLAMTGGAAGTYATQTLASGVTANFGSSTISATGNGTAGATILNAGTVSGANGTQIDFTASNGATINASNTALNTGQFLYTSGSTTNFATLSGTSVVALSGQAALVTATAVTTPTTDYIIANSLAAGATNTPSGNDTINTLTITNSNTAPAGLVTLALGANTFTTNAIIDNSTAGAGAVVITSTAAKPGITSSGANLYIDNYATNSSLANTYTAFNSNAVPEGPGTLDILSTITGPENVTFGGPGVIVLDAAVTTTGNAYLNGANLLLEMGYLTNTGSFVINSGTLSAASAVTFTQASQWNGNFNLSVPALTYAGNGVVSFNGPVTLTNNITLTINTSGLGAGTGVPNSVGNGDNGANAFDYTIGGILTDNGYGYGLTVGANSANASNPNAPGFQNELNSALRLNGTTLATGPLTVLGDGIYFGSATSSNRYNVLQMAANTNAYLGASITLAGLQDVGAGSNSENIISQALRATLTLQGSGNYSFGGDIQDQGTYTTNGTVGTNGTLLVMAGTGTQTLTGTNSFTGGISVNAGTLNIDGSQGGSVVSQTLALGGGNLQYEGTGSTMNLGAVTLTAGNNQITANASKGNTTIALGTLSGTGTVGAVLNIDEIGTNGTDTVTTTSNNIVNGTFGGHVVFTNASGLTTWASATTGTPNTINAYTADTTPLVTTGGATATNYTLANTTTQTQTGTTTIGLLRIDNTTGAGALDLHGQTLNVASNGILFDGSSSYTIADTSGNGKLSDNGVTDNELIVQNYGGKGTSLTIGAVIGDTSTKGGMALVLAGTGNTVLTAVNTYTGATYLNGGTVTINQLANFGTTNGTLNFNGGTLQYAASGFTGSADLSVPGTGGRLVNLGTAGGTIDTNGNTVTFATGNSIGNNGLGSGGLTYVDSANVTNKTAANSGGVLNFNATSAYAGITTIGSGAVVNLGGGTGNGGVMNTTGGTVVASGGTLEGGVTQSTSATQTTSASYAGKLTLQAGGVLAPGAPTATVNGVGLGAGNGNMASGTSGVALNVMEASQLTWQAGGKLSFLLDKTPNTASSLTDSANVPSGLLPNASTVLNLGTGALVKSGTGQFILTFNGTGGYNTDGVPNVYDLINFGATSLTGGLNGNTNFTVDDFTIQGLDGIGVLSFYDNTTADGHAGQEELLLTVIPEPSTWAMLIGGLATLIFWTSRKRGSSVRGAAMK